MENLLFKVYWLGFILLSITLFSGILFSNEIFGSAIIWNHKAIFSLMAWITYGAMLFGRTKYGWRGKKAVVISLFAFVFLFLAYFGTKFVIEVLFKIIYFKLIIGHLFLIASSFKTSSGFAATGLLTILSNGRSFRNH